MGVIRGSLVTNGAGATANSVVTAGITPGVNKLYLVVVLSKIAASSPNAPTITGAGMTWTQIQTVLYAPTQGMRLTVFRAQSTTPGSGALTIDFGGQTQDRVEFNVIELTGTVYSGTNGSGAIVQTDSNVSNTTSTGLSATLSTFLNGCNATINICGALAVVGLISEADYTDLSNGSSGEITLLTAFNEKPDTTVTTSWVSNSFPVIQFGIEIKAQAQGGAALAFL